MFPTKGRRMGARRGGREGDAVLREVGGNVAPEQRALRSGALGGVHSKEGVLPNSSGVGRRADAGGPACAAANEDA